MITLEYSISIESPKEHVWNTMLQPETYKQWVAKSWPSSFYEGEWKEGSEVRFIGPDGSGTLAFIKEMKPFDYMLAEHIAVLEKGGVINKDSDVAKGWIGSTESYTFTGSNGTTHLLVKIETNPGWKSMFDEGWAIALPELKRICENSK
ncbi:MAG TPA: SRPBCC domain-containing protein [Chitinophagaceae bacterium]|nr:SRPBCC domain-containing protein [Chitinophagaceae bacterium]